MLDTIKKLGDKAYNFIFEFLAPYVGEDAANIIILGVLLVLCCVPVALVIYTLTQFRHSRFLQKTLGRFCLIRGILGHPVLSIASFLACLTWFAQGGAGLLPFFVWLVFCAVLGLRDRAILKKRYNKRLKQFYSAYAEDEVGTSFMKIWDKDIKPDISELLKIYDGLQKEERQMKAAERRNSRHAIRFNPYGKQRKNWCMIKYDIQEKFLDPLSICRSYRRYCKDKERYLQNYQQLRRDGFVLVPDGTGIAPEKDTRIEINDNGEKKICNGFDIYGKPIYKN